MKTPIAFGRPVAPRPAVRGPVVGGPAVDSLRQRFFPACYRCNTSCYPIHSRDTHLFRIMKNSIAFVVRGPVVGGARWSCQRFFPRCYQCNTPCYPIHSRDTHLFRIMRKSHFSFWHPSI